MTEISDIIISETARALLRKLLQSRTRRNTSDQTPADLVELRLQVLATTIANVKTLLSTDRPVRISEFYCSPLVTIGTTKFHPKSADSFREDHVLIEGTAGQGKSTLLRYLCSEAIATSGRIALFFELRKLDQTKPLESIVLEALAGLGLGQKRETLRELASAKGVELYLDGYDELTQKEATKIDREIDWLVQYYPLIRLFVSARPHAGLSANTTLTRYKIEPLSIHDAYRMMDKLLSNEADVAKELKEKLNRHTGGVQRLLATPLLVTLLVARYTQTREIPAQLTDFYKAIFETLFERHDHFKAPFRRSRRLKLSSFQYLGVLQKFSFGSLLAPQLDERTAVIIAEWAIRKHGKTEDATNFLEDIADITSLLIKEGPTWSFIHSSIQEYYCACELLSFTDAEIPAEAIKLSKTKNKSARDQVFEFAREIDEYRYLSFASIPYLQHVLYPINSDDEIDEESTKRWIKANVKDVARHKAHDDSGYFVSLHSGVDEISAIQVFVPSSGGTRSAHIISPNSSPQDVADALLELPSSKERILRETGRHLQMILSRLRAEIQVKNDLEASREKHKLDLSEILGENGNQAR